jgi:excisionase family DNA binding protein
MTPDSREGAEARRVDLIRGERGGEVCVPNQDRAHEEVTRHCAERRHGQPTVESGPIQGRPLTLSESAIYLNVTERYMRRLVVERRIPYLKVGRLLRFRPKDLDAYLESCVIDAIARG